MSNRPIVVLILLWNCQNLMSYYHVHEDSIDERNISITSPENFYFETFIESSTIEQTSVSNYQIFDSNETSTSFFSPITIFITEVSVPLLFSIISLTIRTSRIEQYEYFYSIDILINSTCSSKRESNITLIFQSLLFNETKRCLFPSKHHGLMTCENFTYGVRYTVDGYLLCGTRNVTLSIKKELYELIKPKYINSTNSPTSIDALFFLPGLFYRLIIELTSVNQTCSIEYSSISSSFYHCLFKNLIPAQWFILTYYASTDNDQAPSGDVTIVYTELEDFYFRCELNKNNQQIDFYWTNLIASGYSNLTISILTEEYKQLWIILCDPYTSKNICSTKQYHLESGREYYIIAKLKKILPNYNGQKTETCSIKTNLSQIPINSIRHEFLNETIVRLTWLNHPFYVQVQLRNLETNLLENPIEYNQKTALFIHLTEASIYQLEFNISKIHWSSLIQITDYYIQTDFKKLIIENIIRLSENTLIVNINQYNLSTIKIIYCIEEIIDDSLKFCSISNIFNQLIPGSIYNISISIHRDSFQNIFIWKKQTIYKLINTNPSPLRIHTWKNNEYCVAELINRFSISYSTECILNEKIYNCNQLRCGCRYQFHILFNQTNINSLCSKFQCDIQLNNSNFTNVQFQTPLESIKNLRIISLSPILREIQVDFDRPYGCFDRFSLICEIIPLKQRRIFINSTICTDLIPDEFYRIYIETKQIGSETVISNIIETQLILTSNINNEITKKGSNLQSIIIPCVIAILLILILIILVAFYFVYRYNRRKRSTQRDRQQRTTINHTNRTTKMNNIVNQVNIYSNSKQIYPTESKKNILTSRPIRIKDLPFEYEKLIANNYYNLSDEFNKLQNNLQQIPEITQCNQSFKNRYKDIIPYEHSRVKLIPVDECDPGYINANFISGLHNPREYIACQGPLKSTINDHWKMIWEQNVMIIVMLTGLIERGMNKCEQYWPLDLNHAEIFGDISVCVTACVNVTAYELRYIELKKNDEIRTIKHYAFKMWDDHTIPTNSNILINFIRLIRSECHPEDYGPLLVHCSAGVGRSGTFIALDCLLQQFDKLSFTGYLDIYGTIFNMRQCRDKMVQNEHQYLFIYRCLKEEYEKTSGN
ncbi:unnamed protein product [Rotaria sordida]|uniref:Protein-tyrosine-phosphatase n=1 Tax=Rotaria sordida TaxID=392033 RepID=A0A814QGA1_9BILA|nr:unnamed protein product [Rotaria sordida]